MSQVQLESIVTPGLCEVVQTDIVQLCSSLMGLRFRLPVTIASTLLLGYVPINDLVIGI